MGPDEQALRLRVRRAYEWGRGRYGLRRSAPVLPLVAVSLVACGAPGPTALLGLVLVATIAGFTWKGGTLGRSVSLGISGGVVSFAAPFVALGLAGPELGFPVIVGGAFVGGLATGSLLGVRALREEQEITGSVAAASVVAGLTGSLSCLLAGSAGVAGMLVGIALALAPALAVARVRA